VGAKFAQAVSRILKNAFLTALIRRKGQMLGDVEAPSREAAEAEAVRRRSI